MKNRFDTIYHAATLLTAIFTVAAIALLTSIAPYSAIVGFIGRNLSTSASAKTYMNNLLSDEKNNNILTSDRTVYTVNPIDALTKTPDDIAKLIETAKANSSDDKKDGNIIRKQYAQNTVTKKVGNILVRNNTTTQQSLDLEKVLQDKPDITVTDKTKPAVLIFHTHTTESYEMLDREWYAQDYITRSNSPDINMVRVGKEIKQQLEAAGYTVIHDTQIHDEKYTGAYAHSRKSVEEYLKKHPEIQIILDVHRDAIEQDDGTRIKPTANILGKDAAQIMIISGCEEGKVTDFPNWKKNLTFALELQSVCEEMYPGLMRPVYFCQRKYNMDLSPNNLLVEMGSSANTLEEAAYSGRLLGNALVKLLDSTQTKDDIN